MLDRRQAGYVGADRAGAGGEALNLEIEAGREGHKIKTRPFSNHPASKKPGGAR